MQSSNHSHFIHCERRETSVRFTFSFLLFTVTHHIHSKSGNIPTKPLAWSPLPSSDQPRFPVLEDFLGGIEERTITSCKRFHLMIILRFSTSSNHEVVSLNSTGLTISPTPILRNSLPFFKFFISTYSHLYLLFMLLT
jgi:hypothetical protein